VKTAQILRKLGNLPPETFLGPKVATTKFGPHRNFKEEKTFPARAENITIWLERDQTPSMRGPPKPLRRKRL